jgi:hypothetical protein
MRPARRIESAGLVPARFCLGFRAVRSPGRAISVERTNVAVSPNPLLQVMPDLESGQQGTKP